MRRRSAQRAGLRRRLHGVLLLGWLATSVACGAESSGEATGEAAPSGNPLLVEVQRIDSRGRARETELRALAGRERVALLFVGDSLVRRFATVGRDAWEQHYAGLGAANLGVDGDRVQNLLWRLRHGILTGLQPRLVVLLIGTNNTGEATAGQIVEGVLAVVAELRAQLPEARLLLLGLLPKAAVASHPVRAQLAAINARLAGSADARSVHFLDVGPLFLEPDGTLSAALMPDQLHPSAEGYALLARALEPAITKLLH